MHAISSYRGNRPTSTQTQPQTRRQDRSQYIAPQLARSVNTSIRVHRRLHGLDQTAKLHYELPLFLAKEPAANRTYRRV